MYDTAKLCRTVFVYILFGLLLADVSLAAKECKLVRKYSSQSYFKGQLFLSADSLCRAIEGQMNAESSEEKFTYVRFTSTCDYKVSNSGWRDSTYVRIEGKDYEECTDDRDRKSVV